MAANRDHIDTALPDGVLIRRGRLKFHELREARRDVMRQYPEAILLDERVTHRFWVFVAKEGTVPVQQAQETSAVDPALVRRVEAKEAAKGAWCSGCAEVVPVVEGVLADHLRSAMLKRRRCVGSGRVAREAK